MPQATGGQTFTGHGQEGRRQPGLHSRRPAGARSVAQNVVRSVGHRKKRREAERRQKHKLKVAWISPPPPRSRPLSANWKVAGGP
jgi:hypothetical protein